jgi:exonuclease III
MNMRQIGVVISVLILVITMAIGITLMMNLNPSEVEDLRPQLTVTNPSEDEVLSGTVTIDVNVTDEEALNSEIYIDGGLVATANSYSWDTTQVPDGRHTLRFYVEDSAEQSDIEYFQVMIDNEEDLTHTSNLFKIMVYNIKESGVNSNWKTVVKQENPDILVLVETGYFDDRANEALNAYTSEFNEYFSNELPYEAYTARTDSFPTTGESILSRFPISNFTQIGQVPLDDGSSYDVTHDFIHAEVEINGVTVHVFGGHLKASGGETNQNRRNWESEGIINYMDNLGDVPILYLSDQNSYSPVDTGELAPESGMLLGYGPMTMMLDPEDATFGQFASEVHNFTDVFRTLNPDDPGYSYGHQTDDTAIRIDYIIVNQHFEDMLVNSSVPNASPADPASDHYPVTAFLNWSADPHTLSEEVGLETSVNGSEDSIPTTNQPIVENEILCLPVNTFRSRSFC